MWVYNTFSHNAVWSCNLCVVPFRPICCCLDAQGLAYIMHKISVLRFRKWLLTLGFGQDTNSSLLDGSPVCLSLPSRHFYLFYIKSATSSTQNWQLCRAGSFQPCVSFPAAEGSLRRLGTTAEGCDQMSISDELGLRTGCKTWHAPYPHFIFWPSLQSFPFLLSVLKVRSAAPTLKIDGGLKTKHSQRSGLRDTEGVRTFCGILVSLASGGWHNFPSGHKKTWQGSITLCITDMLNVSF